MQHNYGVRLVCIARCKDEINFIDRWYKSLPFVDVFCVTDNGSTDGTYEYLKSRHNVILTRVEGFDEGRDFQILLKMAKAHRPQWILKIDCDEVFEDDAIKNFSLLLDQSKYKSFLFRKIGFHYTVSDNRCAITREYRNGGLYLARNSNSLSIADRKIHVGGFLFAEKPALSNFRVEHYCVQSAADAEQRFSSYSCADPDRKYQVKKSINTRKYVFVEDTAEGKIKALEDYGVDCFHVADGHANVLKANFGWALSRQAMKSCFFILIRTFGLRSLFLMYKERKKRNR